MRSVPPTKIYAIQYHETLQTPKDVSIIRDFFSVKVSVFQLNG